jgi:hypothetical protein
MYFTGRQFYIFKKNVLKKSFVTLGKSSDIFFFITHQCSSFFFALYFYFIFSFLYTRFHLIFALAFALLFLFFLYCFYFKTNPVVYNWTTIINLLIIAFTELFKCTCDNRPIIFRTFRTISHYFYLSFRFGPSETKTPIFHSPFFEQEAKYKTRHFDRKPVAPRHCPLAPKSRSKSRRFPGCESCRRFV